METQNLKQKLESNKGFKEFYFFAIAIILAFGTLEVTGTALQTDKPVVTVVSCSMYPELNVGDILVVKGDEFENYKEGDIIVFDVNQEDSEIPIIHRIVETGDDYVGAQGDNNPEQQEFEKRIEPEQIHGKTVLKIPRLGLIKLLAVDITGFGDESNQPFRFDSTDRCFTRI